jgi:hypothetical protein
MTELDLSGLTAGATGQPLVPDRAGVLAELRHQQRNCGWDEATPLLHDAAQAYREVMGSRRERERAADTPSGKPSKNTFLK